MTNYNIIMTFLKKNRGKLFPGIKDFNKEHKEFKNKKMSEHTNFMDYFWFSPEVYRSIHYIPLVFILLSSVLLWFININMAVKTVIYLFLMYYGAKKGIKAYKMRNVDTNLYDMHIRN